MIKQDPQEAKQILARYMYNVQLLFFILQATLSRAQSCYTTHEDT